MTNQPATSKAVKTANGHKLPVSVRAHAPGYAAAVLIILFFGAFLLYIGLPYASVIESDVPIVVQHTRLDSRQAENALMTTIAFAVD